MDYVLVEMNARDAEPLESLKDTIRDSSPRKPTSLYDVFPKHVADALNVGKKVEAESHEIVTIVFSDIVGLTTISEKFSPLKVSHMLDRLYTAFDSLANKHGVFKVETIGDAYMGVTNLEGNQFETHVKQIAEFAQDAIRAASQIQIDEDDPSMGYIQTRVGFHSGPVVSNVIGSLNPRYALFRDTVNTASRMESTSMPSKIHCSYASAQLLRSQAPEIPMHLRGMIKIKGKGKLKTYWVGDEELLKPSSPNLNLADWTLEKVSEPEAEENVPESPDREPRRHAESIAAPGKSIYTLSSTSKPEQQQDHFIKVHSSSSDQSVGRKAQINMVGTVTDSETAPSVDSGIPPPQEVV